MKLKFKKLNVAFKISSSHFFHGGFFCVTDEFLRKLPQTKNRQAKDKLIKIKLYKTELIFLQVFYNLFFYNIYKIKWSEA